jgi:DNA-binding transcriptional ArsR family regulator
MPVGVFSMSSNAACRMNHAMKDMFQYCATIPDAKCNNEKLSVNDICEKLGSIEQSLLSHHLIKMKDKGILKSKKEGQFVYYSLYLKEVSNMLDCMERCPIK